MGKKTPLNDEDKAAFREAMRGESSWDDDKNSPICQPDQEHSENTNPAVSLQYTSDEDWLEPEESVFFARQGLSAKQSKTLKSGHFKTKACLDCHGMTTEQAAAACTDFISEAQQQHMRELLIIHGKGTVDHKSRGAVLKNYLNQWLRQNESVLAFSSARPRDGGTGALYVLIKAKHKIGKTN